jgi:hypothetical protein
VLGAETAILPLSGAGCGHSRDVVQQGHKDFAPAGRPALAGVIHESGVNASEKVGTGCNLRRHLNRS